LSYGNTTLGRMKIKVKYGNKTIECHIPDTIRTRVLMPPKNVPESSPRKALISSLNDPIQANPLSSTLSAGKKALLIVPDKTRQCILDQLLPIIVDYLVDNGIHSGDITILFANGTHQNQTREDVELLLGADIPDSIRIEQHDSKNAGSLEYITTTSRGTPVFVNKLVRKADIVLTVGGILHHYFAGFGGGPKLIVPGVAGYETAQRNHSYTIDVTGEFHTGCRDGNLDTNPVYLDIVEAVRHIPNIFSINIVLDSTNKPAGFFSGDIISAHRRGTALASKLHEVSIGALADLVIVSPGGAPHDGTFIQSHKAIHHAHYAVKPGGRIVTAAACYDGIGSPTFLPWFDVPEKSLGDNLLSTYSLNGHTALSLRTKVKRNEISLISELDDATVARMGITPISSIQTAIDTLSDTRAISPLVYLLPHGSLTVPILQN
jgi:lactate racemase